MRYCNQAIRKMALLIYCCILTINPAKHAISKTAEVHIPLAWASLADKMGQGKIPRYSHRLMHWKRVTCELHDSYFRLMTIKSVSLETSFGDQRVWWKDAVEKASTQQKAGPPGLRLSSPGERERHNADGHKSESQYIAVLFGLQLPLTHKPFIYSERYIFFKEVFVLLYYCVVVFCMNLQMTIQHYEVACIDEKITTERCLRLKRDVHIIKTWYKNSKPYKPRPRNPIRK